MRTAAAWLLGAVLGMVGTVHGAGLPDYYPANYGSVGTVDGINYRTGQLVVDDWAFELAEDVKIATVYNAADTIFSIRQGVKVGMQYITVGKTRVVQAVWVLPANYGVSSE